jgi:pimeloyl-ACP methyl ester carboxylesterase
LSYFDYPDSVTGKPVRLWYEVSGSGMPLLLIAPGGMKSAVPLWRNAPWNPMEAWSDMGFMLIAMDQRNAGRSSGPIHAAHGWHTFAEDQIALLDYLDVERFLVAGMCIGGAYAMQLLVRCPHRAAGAVLFQTIGLDDNREAFYQMYDAWAAALTPDRADVAAEDWAGLRENMYGSHKYLFACDSADLVEVAVPLMVLMGNDLYHPRSTSVRVLKDVRGAVGVEQWKSGADVAAGLEATRQFLARVRENQTGRSAGKPAGVDKP